MDGNGRETINRFRFRILLRKTGTGVEYTGTGAKMEYTGYENEQELKNLSKCIIV